MKLNQLMKNIRQSLILGLCLFSWTFGMEEDREVDHFTYHNVKTRLEQYATRNFDLRDPSAYAEAQRILRQFENNINAYYERTGNSNFGAED